jgi:hypothetical protein
MPPLGYEGLKVQALKIIFAIDLDSYDAIFWSVGNIGGSRNGFRHSERLLAGDLLHLLCPTPESSNVVCWTCKCMAGSRSVNAPGQLDQPSPKFPGFW